MAIPRFLRAGAVCMIAAGCTTPMQETAGLSSDYLKAASGTKAAITGIPYYLPKTVLPIKISGDFQILPSKAKTEEKDRKPQDYEYVLTVEILAARQVPDPAGLSLLRYNAEFTTDDEFRIGVGASGLLSNVKSTSDDRSGDVVLKLAELAKEAIKAPTALAASKTFGAEPEPDQTPDERRAACFKLLKKFTVEDAFDISNASNAIDVAPLNGKIVEAMKKDMMASPSIVSPHARPLSKVDVGKMPDSAGRGAPVNFGRARPEDGAHGGVRFRIMAPRTVNVSLNITGISFKPANGNKKDICTLQSDEVQRNEIPVLAADPNRTFIVDTSRAMFVKKRVDLLVTDGVLTGIEVDKPSELLAIVSLPVDLLKAIVSIPAELLTIKVNNAESEKKLTAADVELLKLQIDLLKQRQALEDARKPPGQPAPN